MDRNIGGTKSGARAGARGRGTSSGLIEDIVEKLVSLNTASSKTDPKKKAKATAKALDNAKNVLRKARQQKTVTEEQLDAYNSLLGAMNSLEGTKKKSISKRIDRYEQKKSEDSIYMLSNNGYFYRLPTMHGTNDGAILGCMLQSLITEFNSGAKFDSKKCKYYKELINKFAPETTKYTSIDHYKKLLEKLESDNHTHFVDYDSDNSDLDSDDEDSITDAAGSIYEGSINAATADAIAGKVSKLLSGIAPDLDIRNRGRDDGDGAKNVYLPKIEQENVTKLPETDSPEIKGRVTDLNKAIEDNNENAITKLSSAFVVAGYRGIHYRLNHFTPEARRAHRAYNETGITLYSHSVIADAGFDSFDDYIKHRIDNAVFADEELKDSAEELRAKLLELKEPLPEKIKHTVRGKEKEFSCIYDLLQDLYTNDYDGFLSYIAGEIKKTRISS